jgi:protein SCO1
MTLAATPCGGIRVALGMALLCATLGAAMGSRAVEPVLGRPARIDVPDVLLTDQNGDQYRVMSDLIAGRVAVVSFVFTGCSTVCPMVGANMGELDRLLGARVGRDVSLLSVTLDPLGDTPARLAAWRAKFDAMPGWLLLTGDSDRVEQVLHGWQQDTPDIAQHDTFLWLHDPRTDGWTRVTALTSPAALAAIVTQLAAGP